MPTGRPVGKPAKPVEVKRANGNPGKRPLPAAPLPGEGLSASTSVPVAPPLGDAGLELWAHVWRAGRRWLSPESDMTVVTLLCEAQDDYADIRRQLLTGEVERFYQLPNGSFVSHPLVTQLKDLRVQMTAWLAAIGFSPSDRARLGVGEVRVRDELDELEARRAARRVGV